MSNQMTDDWKLYEAGKKYNNSLEPNYYDTVNTNLAFSHGDQWRNLKTHGMPKPVFNIIKPVVTHKVASLTSSKTKIQFEPLAYSEDNPDPQMQSDYYASEIATAEVDNLFEKFKMEHRIREALFDAAHTGDGCAHFYFDINKKPYGGGGAFKDIKGEICMELVDGVNVMFGNANNPCVDIQPYIIVLGRDTVDNLKKEAKKYKTNQSQVDGIKPDSNYNEQAGDSGKLEVESDKYGKALYLIVYRKETKTRVKKDKFGIVKDELGNPIMETVTTVIMSKSVENAYIFKDIDTELSYYPIAWLNWEKQKNQYHGRALCTGILPNQIFINRMFAMVMYHLMLSAFPKPIYDANKIDLWTNEIGTAIKVQNLNPGDSIRNIAAYLEPGNMSNQIVQVIELAMQYTKETLGISDVTLGNVKPENTSAIVAVQKSSEVPLENIRGNLYEWVEDIGKILLDMIGTYYGQRPIVMRRDGQKSIETFDFSIFKNLWLNVRADVGSSSYWSEIASIQTLDNLLNQQRIDFLDYLERVPDEYIPKKSELIAKFKQAMQNADFTKQMINKFMQQLPPEIQQQLSNLPPEKADAQLKQMMLEQDVTPMMPPMGAPPEQF